jgi:CHASE3 domain sensor protein
MSDASPGHHPHMERLRTDPWRTVALLLIVALATGLFFLGIAKQVRDEEESVVALEALRAEIATAESSVRGYTLAGSARFLQQYRHALRAIGTALDDVYSAMGDDNRERIDSLASIFDQWERRFAGPTIALVRSGRREAAQALARTRSGKRSIDKITALLAAEIAEEQQEAKESERVETFLGALAIAAIAALSLAVGLAWRKPRA